MAVGNRACRGTVGNPLVKLFRDKQIPTLGGHSLASLVMSPSPDNSWGRYITGPRHAKEPPSTGLHPHTLSRSSTAKTKHAVKPSRTNVTSKHPTRASPRTRHHRQRYPAPPGPKETQPTSNTTTEAPPMRPCPTLVVGGVARRILCGYYFWQPQRVQNVLVRMRHEMPQPRRSGRTELPDREPRGV